MKNKILFICNESRTVINFRKELILFLIKRGFEVFVIAADELYKKEIEELKVTFFCKNYSNRSKNPFAIISVYKYFRRIIKIINPNLVFTFQLKPNVFGTFAARKCDIPIFNMVEGLGDPFTSNSFSMKIIRKIVSFLYKRAFRHSQKVYFLNNDDKNEFIKRRIVNNSIATIINGIGIDTKLFTPDYNLSSEKRVLCLSRLIKNKGVLDYCRVAKIVKTKRPDIIFDLYGPEAELTKKDLKEYLEGNIVYYGGLSNDVNTLISKSRVLISTSYREGFPRTILEAMALGRPVIAYSCIGVRDSVVDGKTGFLIDGRNEELLADKIIELIDNEEKIITIGKCARSICEKKYDSDIINGLICEDIESFIKDTI